MLIEGRISDTLKPNYDLLVARIAKLRGVTPQQVMDSEPEVRDYCANWNSPDLNLRIRNDLNWNPDDRIAISVWAKRVADGHITLADIYTEKHSFEGPIEARSWIGVSYHLLGIPVDHIQSWLQIAPIAERPHYVRRYLDIGEQLRYDVEARDVIGLKKMTLNHSKYWNVNAERAKMVKRPVSFPLFGRYIEHLVAIRATGHDPHTMINSAEFWHEGWSPEAVARFADAKVTLREVMETEAQGVEGSELIISVLREGMPAEWAITASRSRSQ